jgi:NADPH-dependent curcumin reductase CurA
MSTIPTTAHAWRLPIDQKTWNGPKSLELREVKISPPKQGEVLVKVHAASINYRQVAWSNQVAYLLIQLRLIGYELLAISTIDRPNFN